MATKIATTTIGPENWRNNTLKTIKLAQTVVHKSDKSNDVGRALDPLPHIRDIVATLTNEEVRRYTRDVRVVVSKLRESLLDTNEEIKSMTRGKEALEKALEHIRKDIKLNLDSQAVRTTRPNKEKVWSVFSATSFCLFVLDLLLLSLDAHNHIDDYSGTFFFLFFFFLLSFCLSFFLSVFFLGVGGGGGEWLLLLLLQNLEMTC